MTATETATTNTTHIHVSAANNWTNGLRWSQIQLIEEAAEARGVSCEEVLDVGDPDGDAEAEDFLPRPGFVPVGLQTDRDAILERGEGYALLEEEVLVVYSPEQWPGGHILARQGQLYLLGVGYPEEDEGGATWPPDQQKWVWLAA